MTPAHQLTLNLSGRLVSLEKPLVMGIVNVTPDSFFAGSRIDGAKALGERLNTLVREGAALADLGAYSSRPGAEEVSPEEERRRLRPALQILRDEYPDLPVSVDTFRSDVARMAVEEYGASMINDISGGGLDPAMYRTMAELQVPYILMHMKGDPKTMQQQASYSDVTLEVIDYFAQRVGQLLELGVHDIILDPGFGFSKTTAQNYELLAQLGSLVEAFTQPLLVGVSRKSMIYRPLGISPEEALNGTTFLHALALERGAKILRVHDVRPAVEAVQLYEELRPVLRSGEGLHYQHLRPL
ncbi:dihydropteroate synthase [Porphyromonas sp. oral taxon 278 str. W7784]|uniref:dihydropteroate synthase n=1 Tax=Porphyromonas sp. oral taxon 278 TaxID=712437 RepID=UPI0003AD47D9|nr:dihydropteroate synthase [Porphyromonas sp. oral taxon 278]ERJ70403.1 dihydropteroate synthase [Porphyromonas sp. oral taxon 278 str. W7784]